MRIPDEARSGCGFEIAEGFEAGAVAGVEVGWVGGRGLDDPAVEAEHSAVLGDPRVETPASRHAEPGATRSAHSAS